MFDPRTDLPEPPKSLNFGTTTTYEEFGALFRSMMEVRNSHATERKAIDDLADFIEQNLLDELADQGCIEGFVMNALECLSRDVSNIGHYKPSWRTAACRQVWFKYNH